MACESWEFTVVDGQSYIKDPGGPNGRENSWGIAQFNFPTGLENSDGSTITMSDARDPERALDAAAFNFSIGNAERWSCY